MKKKRHNHTIRSEARQARARTSKERKRDDAGYAEHRLRVGYALWLCDFASACNRHPELFKPMSDMVLSPGRIYALGPYRKPMWFWEDCLDMPFGRSPALVGMGWE